MEEKIEQPIAPTTTTQQDLTVAGQRRINIIWELTQGTIAIFITIAMIYCAIHSVETQVLNYAFISIVTMYFTRTNHEKIGGTGQKNEQVYTGR